MSTKRRASRIDDEVRTAVRQPGRPSGERRLGPLRALALYLVVVFLGGALLAPWLYHAAQGLAPFVPAFDEPRFHRFVHRSLLGLALLGAWPLLRSQGLASFAAIGLTSPTGEWRRLGAGLGLGFVSLAIAASLNLGLGGRAWNADLSRARLMAELGEAAGIASLVSVLEEILFRGVLFGVLLRAVRGGAAVWASALIYALVHFFERPPFAGEVVWSSGLVLLPQMLAGFVDLGRLLPSFLTLTLAGVLLAELRRGSGTLWASIGLHAGWIFWLRAYREVTRDVEPVVCSLCGSARLIDGWTTCLAVALLCLVVVARPSAGQCSR